MNLIEAWKQVPSGDEITLVDVHGTEIIHIIKRGSFAGVVRRLTELVREEEILSDRWRWRIS
jgi:hypothetical protein